MLLLGAINKLTNEYVHPKFAKKMEEYICPECKKDLILCQGEIKIHYFRHKFDSNNPCDHYNNPGETALHKDAKELLKTILNKRVPIRIKRKCYDCSKYTIEINIDTINNGNVELEYRFEYNNNDRIADVAYLENNKLKYIFEICNTHKTREEDRPEPWFEIDADKFIKSFGENSTDNISIDCLRTTQGHVLSYTQDKNICDKCYQHYIIETKKIREHINNMLGFIVTKYNYHSCDEDCKSLTNFPNEHDENCAFVEYPDGIKKEEYIFDQHCYSYEILNYNKQIILLFNDQLGDIRVIILGWNCNIYAYIFDKCDYDINLFNLEEIIEKERGCLNIKFFFKLNWKSVIDYGSGYNYQSDENIIYDLIQFSKTAISKIGNVVKPYVDVENSCCICYDKNTLEWISTCCKHFFHRECLNTWTTQHTTCPICRKIIC
jgi:hypothetical protein